MKVANLLMGFMIIAFASVLLSGCGGEDKVGGLSLAVTTEDPVGDAFVVNAGATYTHPTVANLVNVPITFNTSPAGIVIGLPQEIYTNTSGFAGRVIVFTQGDAPVTLAITATTGDLQDTKVVTIPARTALSASTSTVNLSASAVDDTQEVTISGGIGTLSAVSDNSDIGANLGGSVLTITKLAAGPGSATVTVSDSGSTSTVEISVTY